MKLRKFWAVGAHAGALPPQNPPLIKVSPPLRLAPLPCLEKPESSTKGILEILAKSSNANPPRPLPPPDDAGSASSYPQKN